MNKNTLLISTILTYVLIGFSLLGCENDLTKPTSDCEVGSLGCICDGNQSCDRPLECNEGMCQPVGCEPGMVNCPCDSNGECQDGLNCNTQGFCLSNAGENGERCFNNGTCNDGNRCAAGFVCELCDPGTENCSCFGNGTCEGGLSCEMGRCILQGRMQPMPPNPKCFTPCRSGFTDGGGNYRACSIDGLLEGCINGEMCVNGACVASEDEDVDECQTDIECTDFQVCVQGQCISNCEYDADCGDTMRCYRHACRLPCVAAEENCDENSYCSIVDGDQGYCMPLAAPKVGPPLEMVEGSFSISETRIRLSNTRIRANFRIINEGPQRLTFTVRKVYQANYTADGLDEFREDENPLPFLRIGQADDLERVRHYEVELNRIEDSEGNFADIYMEIEGDPDANRWDGALEISAPGMGTRRLRLDYSTKPEGRWVGNVYYFNQFDDTAIEQWVANKELSAAFAGNSNFDSNGSNNADGEFQFLKNAFLRQWIQFRRGGYAYLSQLKAIITSTVKESWKWPSVREACESEDEGNSQACYLYTSNRGYEIYSNTLSTIPVPTGVIEFPVAIDIENDNEAGTQMRGKIVSSLSLHYAGDPELTLAFEGDPSQCVVRNPNASGDSMDAERSNNVDAQGNCIAFLSGFESTIAVGGRYYPGPDNENNINCSGMGSFEVDGGGIPKFAKAEIPWIVPGFFGNTYEVDDGQTTRRYQHECRDQRLPFGPIQERIPNNLSLAGSNPIPDGRHRVRHVEFIDGMLVNQETMLILFKEHFRGFGAEGESEFSAYGLMELNKTIANLGAEENPFEGNDQESFAQLGEGPGDEMESKIKHASCDPEIVDRLDYFGLQVPQQRNPAQAIQVAKTLITGIYSVQDVEEQEVPANRMHYLCHDTGYFDGGPRLVGEANPLEPTREGCPAGSTVTYFTEVGNAGLSIPEDLSGFACQQGVDGGTCEEVFERWIEDPNVDLVLNPFFKCKEVGRDNFERRHCDTNRLDLLADKTFYVSNDDENRENVLSPIDSEIDNAFRYKTRFRNRRGQNIGFTPEICIPYSNAIPYCYDPEAIESIRKRVDCIVHLYSEHLIDANLQGDQANDRNEIKDFLDRSFSYDEKDIGNGEKVSYDGFERLNAELLIMLGDEAYTNAFKSRFDLAGGSIASFEGSLFEPNGIDLAGVAGYELFNLYKATQYYQLVIDRFYSLSSYIWKEVRTNESLENSFVNHKTVVTYFERLLRASTQHTRAWSEIAKRYQIMNRPDLARFVIERSYTSAYIESVVISQLMKTILDKTETGDELRYRSQLANALDKAARTYQAALLDMREVYSELTDDLNYFGFSPDYIPLPALDPNGPNAFQTLLTTAQSSIERAAQKEERAIQSNRSYETDTASFQSELAQIRNTYENQLAELCGTFTGDDGNVYPAIPKYAYLNETTRLLGNPCGFAGNGEIFTAVTNLELRDLDLRSIEQSFENTIAEINIEKTTIERQCNAIIDNADIIFDIQSDINSLDKEIRKTQHDLTKARRALDLALTAAEGAACAGLAIASYLGAGNDTCGATKVISVAKEAVKETAELIMLEFEDDIRKKQNEIVDLEASKIQIEGAHQCEMVQINGESVIAQKVLRLKEIDLEALKADYAFRLTQSEINRLRDKAKRIISEQEENEQLSINIEAARNDPNVRIYKNDSVINADRAFDRAIRDAYRATKVYEYYTSQSYAALNELSLVRMVSYGDYNLDNYIEDLEENYYEFLETAGRPDLRVDIISLRDEILAIPYFDTNAEPISQLQRVTMLRESLADPRLLNAKGHLVLPFNTSFERISPLTRNHKVAYMEAEIIGSDIGDTIGRVYIAQTGTGVVHSLEGDKAYYRFPERTAVLNPFFNGVRVFVPEVYRNNRLRDRPYINTNWELVLNQRDEQANQDINLNSLTDVRIYIYYQDFTEL